MKRLFFAAAFIVLTSLASAPAVRAEMPAGEHRDGAIGFHDVEAPIGIRWWLGGQKIGIDLGFGYGTTPATSRTDETLSHWAIEAGVPFVMHSWDRAHVLFRPGLLYQSEEIDTSLGPPPAPFATDSGTLLDVTAELEAEVFIVQNISVSASTGLRFHSENPPSGFPDVPSTFDTIGRNFTDVGFHVYFLGGGGSSR